MLDIKNMSEENKLFNFMPGLQAWVLAELLRQRVKDLPVAMFTADTLVEYKMLANHLEKKSKGKAKFQKKDKQKKKAEKSGSTDKQTDKPSLSKGDADSDCFICNGPHRAKNCTKKEKLNAIMAEDADLSDEPTQVNPLQLLNTICKKEMVARRRF